ncbi:ribonuclease III [Pseudobacteriovorax antillogorgiicola]|uniref:Ribonuclease 3 n=1 Tax=Pseudobacteriovorax antillogorgiicola TaxID=1513793 RepID=A0A1Y6CCN1_9BACT|nr:ribonuclease III [Pseudobacteriovorax antillogorgiicola]TCS48676.1 RNAse III [Pseudobacteriovorax antillogorgiicola]SMF54946.1 RNAse III [Pseudobacteriovorax antillogorgiicola]
MQKTPLFQSLSQGMQAQLSDVHQLCDGIGYQFKNTDLLVEALTHSSAAQELLRRSQGELSIPWNERLEFLGDSVLGLVLSTHLLHHPEGFAEGQLSKIRAALVNESSLAGLSKTIGLGRFLLMSVGEEKGRGRHKPSVLADAFEALLGAIYVDGGFAAAEKVILDVYRERLASPLETLIQKDYKSRLQELTQGTYKEAPEYRVVDQKGPDHDISFQVDVNFRGQFLGTGRGPSKKVASQNAARHALETVLENPDILTEGMT